MQLRKLLKGRAHELLKTSRMRRLRGLLKMSVWPEVEDRAGRREGKRPGGEVYRPKTAVGTKTGRVEEEGGPMGTEGMGEGLAGIISWMIKL